MPEMNLYSVKKSRGYRSFKRSRTLLRSRPCSWRIVVASERSFRSKPSSRCSGPAEARRSTEISQRHQGSPCVSVYSVVVRKNVSPASSRQRSCWPKRSCRGSDAGETPALRFFLTTCVSVVKKGVW